jgi:hypothetical protein
LKDLIERAAKQRVEINLKGGKISVKRPQGVSPEIIDEIRENKDALIRELSVNQSVHQLRSAMIWLVDAWNSSAMFNRPKHDMTGDFWMTMFEWDEQATELRSKYNYDKCPLGECDVERQPVWCYHCSPKSAAQLSWSQL